MQDTSLLSFDIDTTDPLIALQLEIWLDDFCILKSDHVREKQNITHEVNDADGEHELRIIMSGKKAEHTQIDQNNCILQDVMLQIDNFFIDGIDLNQLFQSKITYTHDFNGTQSATNDTFHGFMGCNGTLSFKFSTPMYMWLLENM